MKNRILSSILAIFMFASVSSVSAIEFETIVPFGGNSWPAAKMYYGLTDGVDLLFGFSAKTTGDSRESDLDLELGVRSNLPVLGVSDVYFEFDKYNDSSSDGTDTGTDFRLNALVIGKNWLYRITDQVKIGFTADLLRVYLNSRNSKQAHILPSIEPAVGATISF